MVAYYTPRNHGVIYNETNHNKYYYGIYEVIYYVLTGVHY